MGMIDSLFGLLFGGGRNVIKDTAEVFRENSEAGAQRSSEYDQATLAQFAAEFASAKKTRFDSVIDGINRIPRPLMALSVIFLFASAMTDPVWFATRMQGLALVPEPLWWLMGVVVSFYFGARHQMKTQQFQRSIAETLSRAPVVVENIAALRGLNATSPGVADTGTDSQLAQDVTAQDENLAVEAWKRNEVGK